MDHKTQSFLFAGSCFYAMDTNSGMYEALLEIARTNPIDKEAMWEVFAELRTKLANPKTNKFYQELKKLFPVEYKQTY